MSLPRIKFRVLPRFPVSIIGESGITVNESNGVVTITGGITTAATIGNANPIRTVENTDDTPVILLPANGFQTEINYSADGSFADKDWVTIRQYNYDRTETAGEFFNPANLPIRDDYTLYERATEIAFVSRNQLMQNDTFNSVTATVIGQQVTAVVVNINLTGYTAGQVVGWTAYLTSTITAQGTVTANGSGVINTAQFASASTGLPTAAIFTGTPIVLVQQPNISNNTFKCDVGPLIKLARQMPDAYPAADSFLGHISWEGDSGTAGIKGAGVEYIGILGVVEDPTTGAADGIMSFRRTRNGSLTSLYLGGGFYVPGSTTDAGVGTANFTQVWENGSRVVAKDGSGNVTIAGQLSAGTQVAVSKASAFPDLSVFRTDAHGSSAGIGRIMFLGRNSTPADFTYAFILGVANDHTAGSEDSSLQFDTAVAGTVAARATIGAGLMVGDTTDPGAGGVRATASIRAHAATAVPAGGTAGAGLLMSSTTNLGVFFGSGAPTLSAAQGSLYVRTDGSSTSTRLYVNTNGTTGWTNVTTAT